MSSIIVSGLEYAPPGRDSLFFDVSFTVGPGDRAVLVGVNGTPVTGVDQVREIVAKSASSVALLIERHGNKIFVPVRLG